ncbi:MAG: flagellin, partial [Sinobacterium sp.]
IARGRIEDTNYASEVTALVKSQIIAEASIALLAQANLKAQTVLVLLRPYEGAANIIFSSSFDKGLAFADD